MSRIDIHETEESIKELKQALKSANREKQLFYKEARKQAREIFKTSNGILLAFILIFSLFRNYGMANLGSFIWGLVLQTAKQPYLTDHNLLVLIQSPQLIITALFLIFCYLFFALWELSGVFLCVEAHYQKKQVKFLRLFLDSLLQIKHILAHGNFVVLGLVFLILPLFGMYKADQMINLFSLPEFIQGPISSKWWGIALQVLVYIGIAILLLRNYFTFENFILERNSLSQSAKDSASLMKGHYIRTLWEVFRFSLVRSLILVVLPALACFAIIFLSMFLMWEQDGVLIAFKFVYSDFIFSILLKFFALYMEINLVCFMVVTFHKYKERINDDSPVALPEKLLKTTGRIHNLKFLYPLIYLGTSVLSALFFVIFTLQCTYSPATALTHYHHAGILAHKGYSEKAPENTMDAFDAAYQTGIVSYAELDVRETKDGVVVVIHNESLLDATGKDISIYDITYEELQKLTAHYGMKRYPNARISSLDEVLTAFDGKMNFLIETKPSPKTPDLEKKVAELMEKHGIVETSLVQSGSYESISKVKEYNPNIQCGFIVAAGFGPYYDLPAVDFVSMEHSYVTSNLVRAIHMRGKLIFTWTVNRKAAMEDVLFLSVDGIITDRIELAHSVMEADNSTLTEFLGKAIEAIRSRIWKHDYYTTPKEELSDELAELESFQAQELVQE